MLEKKIELFAPSPYFAWTIHLDGDRDDHDRSVCQSGVYDRAVAAIKLAKARGFRVNINTTTSRVSSCSHLPMRTNGDAILA